MHRIWIIGICLLLLAPGADAGRQATKNPAGTANKTAKQSTRSARSGGLASGFTIGIRIEDAQKNSIGGEVRFGVDSLGTPCVDEKLGESYLPPSPPAGLPDLRFVAPRPRLAECYDQGLNGDIRVYSDPAQVDTYKVQFQAPSDGYPIIIRWDPLKKYYDGDVQFRVPLSGKTLNVNMKIQNSVELTEEIPSFFIIAAKPVLPPAGTKRGK